jgi:N-acetylneuraminic acid mutarotase
MKATHSSKRVQSLQKVKMFFEQCPALKGKPPAPRGGHSTTVIGSKLWIFGGCNEVCLNDLHVFDTESNEWKQVRGHGKRPIPRWGHSCTAFGHKLYIFGGYDGNFMNDLHIFDTETMKWRRGVAKGQVPSPRRGHTAVAFGDTLYVIGGIGECNENNLSEFALTTVYALDCVEMKWDVMKTKGLPETKLSQFHATAVINETVWFFGGTNGRDAPDPHYYALNLQTKSWEMYEGLPVAVYSHSCTALPVTTVKNMEYAVTGQNCLRVHTRAKEEMRIVMFGGFDGISNRNDVHVFDPVHKVWKRSVLRGHNIPPPRSDHSASLVENRIYIFGGYGGSKLYFNDMYLLVDSHDEMYALKEGMKQLTCHYTTLQRKMERIQRRVMLLNGQIEFDFSELSARDLRVLKEYHSNVLREIKKFEEKNGLMGAKKSTKTSDTSQTPPRTTQLNRHGHPPSSEHERSHNHKHKDKHSHHDTEKHRDKERSDGSKANTLNPEIPTTE